jgi:hypothetical protein
MREILFRISALAPLLIAFPGAAEDPQAKTGEVPVYVTRQDCSQLAAHHADASVNYQPGVDVRGKYVAPADLPGPNYNILPDKVTFDLKVNPLAYGAQQSTTAGGKFSNTAVPMAHIEVDLLSGAVKLNGQSLDGEQTRIVTEACRRAGYH